MAPPHWRASHRDAPSPGTVDSHTSTVRQPAQTGLAARGVLPLEMVDNSFSLCKPTSGRFSVMRQSRHAFSSQSEAPSKLYAGNFTNPPAT